MCKRLHVNSNSIDHLSTPIQLICKSCPGPSSEFTSLQPHPQLSKVLPQAPPAKKSHFSKPLKEELDKTRCAQNTESSTKWALENLRSQMTDRNECSEEKCLEMLLEDMAPDNLNKWLSIFVAETRKVNGEPYPPTTIQLLLAGLQHHMQAIN